MWLRWPKSGRDHHLLAGKPRRLADQREQDTQLRDNLGLSGVRPERVVMEAGVPGDAGVDQRHVDGRVDVHARLLELSMLMASSVLGVVFRSQFVLTRVVALVTLVR